GDHVAVEIAPGRLAVQEQDWVACAVLYIRHPQAFDVHVLRFVWEAGQRGEAPLWRAQDRALGPARFHSRELGDLEDVGRIQALGDFGYPYREGKQVGVDLVLGRTR